MNVRIAGGIVLGVVLLSAGAFLTHPSTGGLQPVSFDDTLAMGMSGVDVSEASAEGYALPRGQVFYGQYEYVVGYYGVESMVEHLGSGDARRQFGDPLAVYVSDFSNTDPYLVNGSYLDLRYDPMLDWVGVNDAVFVVGSSARTPAGPTAVPFSDPADAAAFADEYGGRVVDWTGLTATLGDRDRDRETVFREAVRERSNWADRRVDRRDRLRERPVSVVVGEDVPTLAGAIDAAPPNTTIAVPPGRYDANLTVDSAVTIRGAGRETVLDGGGNGTVLTVRSDRVAITSLSITGVGEVGNRSPSAGNTSRWEDRIMRVYGRSDAGVCFADADESLLADVRIDTPATGVLLRYSDRTVVDNVTVRGTETTAEGSMGVLPMYSRVVVEDTTVRGGRDGIYTHRADGSVLRDNDAAGMRYGIHEMYTSGLLLRNNTLRQARTGIILMTRPTDNLLVGNLASNNTVGIVAIGDTSYLSRNVVVDNERGIDLATTRSLVTGNTVVRNAVGVSAGTVIPSNHVTGNDIVANDVPVKATAGPVRVWTVDGTGNYWGPTAGGDRNGDGAIDRSFRPTDRIDVTASSATGGPSLVRSPAMGLLERVAGSVPGLRGGGVIDTAPRTDPTRPELLAEVRNGTDD